MNVLLNTTRARFTNNWGVTPQEFKNAVYEAAEPLRTFGAYAPNIKNNIKSLAMRITNSARYCGGYVYSGDHWSPEPLNAHQGVEFTKSPSYEGDFDGALAALQELPIGAVVCRRVYLEYTQSYTWRKVTEDSFLLVEEYSEEAKYREEQSFPLIPGIRAATAAHLGVDPDEAFNRAFDEVMGG